MLVAKIISVHSFRGGTGKSNTTANLAALLAAQGMRVGVVDTDIMSPGIHVIFGLNEDHMPHSLNDYLWGECNVEDAACEVEKSVTSSGGGPIFLIPSSMKTNDIARILREGYDVGLLNDGYQRLTQKLGLDVLLIDTHPGLNEETLLSIAISDVLVLVMRPDSQDYQGTAVTVEVARKLDVPQLLLVVNKTPQVFEPAIVKQRIEDTFGCEVAAVLPHSDEMMMLASEGIFAVRYPDHPMTALLKQVVSRILA
jgi:MinD-like ATPase involved in chromosome partitioning or flagellar assembly